MQTQESTCMPPNAAPSPTQPYPQLALLDLFFPGFSAVSGGLQSYGIDLNLYVPFVILIGGTTVAWQYFSDYVWSLIETHLMSTVHIKTDDEIYNILMAWVASQQFAKRSRSFIANTNLNSRAWNLWRWNDDEDDEDEDMIATGDYSQKKKPLAYTPSFGSHVFLYKGWLLRFRRSQNTAQPGGFIIASEREEISISCFGRNPAILKQLLLEARADYLKKDMKRTMIYRGSTKAGETDPTWQRCMARTARPFSTVILDEKLKQDLVDDVSDYLSPSTRNWYSNRGIPWRRGYLLSGPPGTGKSSLSLALAGYFKMRIYIVSLTSFTANEENLSALFADLPPRCVVLLEDIDTAGLTHTREDGSANTAMDAAASEPVMVPGQLTVGLPKPANLGNGSRLSLSGLLNILDGVASQEGRVLIMTTNHIEKLDRALIRPGRIDLIVEFTLATDDMIGAIFRAIFAPLEGDKVNEAASQPDQETMTPQQEVALAEQEAKQRLETVARISDLSQIFVAKIPAHEFSPAEIQGFLLKHKRNPQAALDGAESWVLETRKQKKEKELREAEQKRAEEEDKKKKENEKKKNATKTNEEQTTTDETKTAQDSNAGKDEAKQQEGSEKKQHKPGKANEDSNAAVASSEHAEEQDKDSETTTLTGSVESESATDPALGSKIKCDTDDKKSDSGDSGYAT